MSKDGFAEMLCRFGVDKGLRLFKFGKVTILSLHRISDESDYFFEPIRPSVFENFVKHIRKHYKIISFDELSEIKKKSAGNYLILTFDDGYHDFYEYALPILAKYNLPSNHNIVNECANENLPIWTHRFNHLFNHCRINKIDLKFCLNEKDLEIGLFDNNWNRFHLQVFLSLLKIKKQQRLEILTEKENLLSTSLTCRMMNWKEIAECSDNRVEIGSHTYSHDSIPTITDDEILTFEIAASKIEIENKIKKSVKILALPNGQGDEKINKIVRNSGYKFLLYVNDSTNKLKTISDDNLIVLDRINLLNESLPEMKLRTELFQTKLRKYVRL